jgi:hypothetical protein
MAGDHRGLPRPRRKPQVNAMDEVFGTYRCHAAGSNSSKTAGYTGARSVVTSTGRTLVEPIVRSKNRWAAFVSRRAETGTSTT